MNNKQDLFRMLLNMECFSICSIISITNWGLTITIYIRIQIYIYFLRPQKIYLFLAALHKYLSIYHHDNYLLTDVHLNLHIL